MWPAGSSILGAGPSFPTTDRRQPCFFLASHETEGQEPRPNRLASCPNPRGGGVYLGPAGGCSKASREPLTKRILGDSDCRAPVPLAVARLGQAPRAENGPAGRAAKPKGPPPRPNRLRGRPRPTGPAARSEPFRRHGGFC